MARICWDWCTLPHEHNFEASRTVAGRATTDFLPQKERDAFFTQTGVPVKTYSDIKKHYAATGQRSLERGEHGDVVRKQLKEWVDGGSQGPCPVEERPNLSSLRKPVDIRQLYWDIRNRGTK